MIVTSKIQIIMKPEEYWSVMTSFNIILSQFSETSVKIDKF